MTLPVLNSLSWAVPRTSPCHRRSSRVAGERGEARGPGICGRVCQGRNPAMGSGMSKIVEGLYLGNIRDSEDRESLGKHGITHILSVHNNAKPSLEDMTYLCISASDSSNQNLLQHFKESIRFVHECRLRGGRCLIHCLAGVSRSTTLLVAYLMTVSNLGWEECLAAVKAVRSYAGPNSGFQQQLQEYEKTSLKEYRAWIRQQYGKNPFDDQEELQRLLSQHEEKTKEQPIGPREPHWTDASSPARPPSRSAGCTGSPWVNR
ncbi:dual specificity protein phosphatase 22-A-like isoform X2 [Paroedura picta]|uniref:dual specificity protein phosphatase 22-A-like isoform X2 n=1 Tax=Paroedura picta TaxID=143630 RepID=UPI004055E89F